MKYSIIIPCYNEANNIDDLISRITPLQEKYDLEYILVENGSKDCSKEYFQKNIENHYQNIRVVYVDSNQGYGYGLQQGIKAAMGEYIGWIHADLQMAPEELIPFFCETEKHSRSEKLFIKGRRTNRSMFDVFFTNGQSIVDSLLFGAKIYDVGAIPVLFSRSLVEKIQIDSMPNDFSIELYVYIEAVKLDYNIIRFKVKLRPREKGASFWDHGLSSKIKQSKVIISDSFKIKKGEKVL